MTTFKKYTVTCLALCTCVYLTSCDDDDDGSSNNPSAAQIENILLNGSWNIERLIDDNDDYTTEYAPYTLTFSENGQVQATHASDSNLSRSGTYDVFTDDGRVELEMNFVNPGIVDELNDDWYFVTEDGGTITWNDSGEILILSQQ